MSDAFDRKKFIEKKTQIINEAEFIAKDIGRAYIVKSDKYSKFRNKSEIKQCYLILKDEKVFVVTGLSSPVWENWDLKNFISAKPYLINYKEYGEDFIRIQGTRPSYEEGKAHLICLSKEQKESLLSTKAELKQKKKETQINEEMEKENKIWDFLLSVENFSKKIIENEKTYLMLYNLFDQHLNYFFWDITIFNPYEDDLLSEILETEKKSKFSIKDEARNKIEKVLYKFISLLVGKKYTSNELQGKFGLLVILKALQSISLDYYSKKFADSYSGYFVDLEGMNFQQCISTYYSIDLIDKKDESNISLFTYFLIKNKKIDKPKDKGLFLYGLDKVKEQIDLMLESSELDQFELQLLATPKNNINKVNIDDVDLMNGNEFEQFICHLFKKMGYSVNQTKTTGDQGVDVIAAKRGHRIGIQAKCYSNSVSNKAIQEVVAGINHYKLAKGMVVTNNYFTKSAIELGNSNGVVLWDRAILKEKITEYY